MEAQGLRQRRAGPVGRECGIGGRRRAWSGRKKKKYFMKRKQIAPHGILSGKFSSFIRPFLAKARACGSPPFHSPARNGFLTHPEGPPRQWGGKRRIQEPAQGWNGLPRRFRPGGTQAVRIAGLRRGLEWHQENKRRIGRERGAGTLFRPSPFPRGEVPSTEWERSFRLIPSPARDP